MESVEIDPQINAQLIFYKVTNDHSVGKYFFQGMVPKQFDRKTKQNKTTFDLDLKTI